ncbi:hypothetical protein C8R44DRAFT_533129, partial [Mycena epipterygia]
PNPIAAARGSLAYDIASRKYQTRWETWPEFETWLKTEQHDNAIELLSTVLGNYSAGHNHPIGNANLRFTQIPKDTREYIAGLLRLKVMPEHILHLIHQGVYDADDLFENDLTGGPVAHRAEFIQLRDIRRIEKDIEAETVRLHPDDGLS